MNHSLRCTCGKLRGHVSEPEKGIHLMCYCKDCQAFANFLGKGAELLDAQGGSDIVAVHPRSVHFTEGQGELACMSLSPNGLLRWYARCCNTPIANTPRSSPPGCCVHAWTAAIGIRHFSMPSTARRLSRPRYCRAKSERA